jgi:parallel beta-helix repeat protein
MTIRPKKLFWGSKSRKARVSRLRAESRSDMRLESLEPRQLMAVGPQLAGIQVNDGSLLSEGQVRSIAPADLTFRFSQAVDTTTLSGIRITRAGLDGVFDVATATTDFNTSGAVVMDFTAKASGMSGDGVSLQFIKNPLGAGLGPRITVQGKTINVELNTTTGSETRATQLRDALNSDANASKLLTASIRSGGASTAIIATSAITYSPVTLMGASTPSVASSFNVGKTLEIEFIAKQTGVAGQGIEIKVTKRDMGGVSPPTVSVKDKAISVELNSNAASPTSAQELVDAINANSQASALVIARLNVGSPSTAIGSRTINYSPLTLAAVNDVVIEPGYLGIGSSANEIVMRFKEALPDDLYHVDIVGTGASALRGATGAAFGDNTQDGVDNGVDFGVNFELDLGAKILAIVPQPVTRDSITNELTQARDQIVVYFNNDDLRDDATSAENPDFYQLILTKDTVSNRDDVVFKPTTVSYDSTSDKAVLTFAAAIDELGGPGTYRLRIGTSEAIPQAPAPERLSDADNPLTDEVGSSFAGAYPLGTLGGASRIISSQVHIQPYGIEFPGASDMAGDRDIPFEFHYNQNRDGDTSDGQIAEIHYNFRDIYGYDPNGNALRNAITEAQKQRAREIFAMYSQYLGVQFVETTGSAISPTDITIATGDLRALNETITNGAGYPYALNGATTGTAGRPTVILDNAEKWYDGFGDDVAPNTLSWFETAMGEIGNILGLGHTYDLPARTMQGDLISSTSGAAIAPGLSNAGETVYPGDQDIVHGQFLYRPESNDIDLYKFEVSSTGLFTAETFAERSADSSLLDTNLRLYRENADGTRELISQNDDHFSNDSYIKLDLVQGTYYLGVSASGNNDYDPTIDDSGIGGLSQGKYDLRLNFRPDVTSTIVDTTGTALDGDLNGEPGGVQNFWFEAKPLDRVLRVTANANAFSAGQTVTLIDAAGISRVVNLKQVIDGRGLKTERDAILDAINSAGFGVTATPQGSDGIVLKGERRVTLSPGIVALAAEGKTIFVDKIAAANADGSLLKPFNNLANPNVVNAFASAMPGDIVRVVGNGGINGDLSTANDSYAYEIGFGGAGNTMLSDGSILAVPQGVTMMIDAGAVLKLRQSAIVVGSTTASVNRSAASIQVLGTPVQDVFLTSYNNEELGIDTNPITTTAAPGDWGGIDIRHDVERAQGRFVYENEGIFLNYINHASISFGGGGVFIDSLLQTVNPVDMAKARPTVTFNTITDSAQAAIAADPDSFEETNFHEPRSQFSEAFTSDYDRVGPHVRGNTLSDNSKNGLFVRISTPAGNQLQPVTVAARFDDTDIPHIISQNLVVQGTPGGPILGEASPATTLVTLTSQAGGSLTQNQAYNYKLTFVDANGYETAASSTTVSTTLTAPGHASILLSNLPAATSPFVARKLYRSVPGGADYTLVTTLDASTTTYRDTGKTAGGLLSTSTAVNRPRLDARLAIDPGTIVKLESSRIDVTMGGQLIAEGRDGQRIVFTSTADDRFGAAGTFDTNNDGSNSTAAKGDWGGLFLGQMSKGSLDYNRIIFGGGITPIEGAFAGFNPVEIHQADVRLTHSILEDNASGTGGNAEAHRLGRGANAAAAVFVRGAQPIIVDNIIRDNSGSAISINLNGLNSDLVRDPGRTTGPVDQILLYGDNQGPMVRENQLASNQINGMEVRGGILTTQGVWDDTDIVHVLRSEAIVPDFHVYGGLRLESSATKSLVVKLSGGNAGFTSTGRPLDIDDRIGGSLHIVGQPGYPVILTSLADDTVGGGFDPDGLPQTDTNGDGASQPAPGDWRGVLIDQYSNDRNVGVILEREEQDAAAPGVNATPATAQFLGALASGEKSSDENLRLGFEIQGYINEPNDIDVYSFLGVSGTEVWFDIDRTTYSLDAVVELIDANGRIIAQSNDSTSETVTGAPLYEDQPTRDVNILQNNSWRRKDDYTINPRDAGFRMVLPGSVGETGTFHVRVRSSNLDSNDLSENLQNETMLGNGLTSGVYQLQIRLRDTNEVPGSAVQYAEIRYATVGIEVAGMPIHSPLTGEAVEDPSGATLNLGNLLNTDRAALAVSGDITTRADVDSYQFQLRYDAVEANYSNDQYVSTVFDVDYADGISRPDTSLWVFDANGRLILRGKDSNIAEDRPAALNGADLDDLSRGSVGELDPFIGPVLLPEGVYTTVVTSNGQIPQEMDQYLGRGVVNNYYDPTATNSQLRLEPINSVARIAEDRIGQSGGSNVVGSDTLPVLFDTSANSTNVVPYTLGDVVLFVSSNGGIDGNDQSTVRTVNPFTGQVVTTLGDFAHTHGDIAMRPEYNDQASELEGSMWTFSIADTAGVTNDGTVMFRQLNTGTAKYDQSLEDGIITYRDDPAQAGLQETVANVGIRFNAMTFASDTNRNLWAVGDRDGSFVPGATGRIRNILYQFDADNGAADSYPSFYFNSSDRRTGQDPSEIYQNRGGAGTVGAATQKVERGILDINTGAGTLAVGPGGDITGIAVMNGVMYAVSNAGGLYTVSGYNGIGEAATANYVQSSAQDLWGINFQGLAVMQGSVENGRYQTMLFAIDQSGELYAFNSLGQLQPVFANGQTHVSTGVSSARGLAFSTLTTNLWKTNSEQTNVAGHGVDPAFDNSRVDSGNAGLSYYFGSTNGTGGVGQYDNNHYDFPGGAHGSLVSNEFNLKGYSAADQPMLYFNYYLDTEADSQDYSPGSRLQRDSFRVFVSGDDGGWTLLGTNNSFQSRAYADEYDYGAGDSLCTYASNRVTPCVYPLFNNTNEWRQARIPLGDYAGQERVRLRFDFSTAGAMDTGESTTTGDELRAVPGHLLRDGQTLTLSLPGNGLGAAEEHTFEFDLGYTIISPSGANITDGDSFTIDMDGPTSPQPDATFEFDNNGATTDPTATAISFEPTDTPAQIAAKIARALASITDLKTNVQGHRVNLIDGTPITLMTATVAGLSPEFLEGSPDPDYTDAGNIIIRVDSGMDRNQVAAAIQQRLADIYSVDAVRENEANDTHTAAQNLESSQWTKSYRPDVTNPLTESHVTVIGGGDGASVDYYRFTGKSGTVRIDLDSATAGMQVTLLKSDGRTQVLPAASFIGDTPEIVTTLPSDGTYYVLVAQAGNASLPLGNHYTLHVSNAGHTVVGSGAGNIANIKRTQDLVRIIGQDYSTQSPGTNNGQVLGVEDNLAGDVFGAFNASYPQYAGSLTGMSNNNRGVWIDDVIVGLAERGEMVINSSSGQTANFVSNTELLSAATDTPQQEILVGEYEMEIRRGIEFAAWPQTNPIPATQMSPELGTYPTGPDTMLYKSIDSNDRLDQQTSLVVTPQVSSESEPNDTRLVAQDLELLTWTRSQAPGVFDSGSDPHVSVAGTLTLVTDATDVFSFSARPTDVIHVDIDGAALESFFYIQLIGPGGIPLASNFGANPDLTFTLPGTAMAGTYYASVTLFGAATGDSSNYTLHVSNRNHAAGSMGSALHDGQLFQVSDGVNTVVFEFDDAAIPASDPDAGVASGNVRIPFLASDSDQILAETIRDAINSPEAQAKLKIVAALSDGAATGLGGTSGIIDLVGNAVGDVTGALDFGSIFTQVYGTTSDFNNEHNYHGDSNAFRDQGQILLQSNTIVNSLQTGIRVNSGDRTRNDLAPLAGDLPHAGPPKNFSELNGQRLAPGVTIENNIVAKSGSVGIEFLGDANNTTPGAVPFGRIVSNTVYGSNSNDVGIRVADQASPTILNNIISNVAFGISVSPDSNTTVVGANLFDVNVPNPIVPAGFANTFSTTADPKFLDPANNNFYLGAGSKAIDSSLDSLDDRADFATRVKAPLGIAASPILAPELDVVGQVRADDPTVNNAGPQGANVFKDRGALDRADFSGPTAVLITPQDNDRRGDDADPRSSYVALTNVIMSNFSIQLLDGVEPNRLQAGIGLADDTVLGSRVTVYRDNQKLVQGVDYTFSYDTTNNTIRLTPIAGIWEVNRAYEIELSNDEGYVIATLSGKAVKDGDSFTVTDQSGNTVQFEYDSGYNLQVPQTLTLQIPATGGSALADGETFSIGNGTRTEIFEFDKNGVTATGNIAIAINDDLSANDVANQILAAIKTTALGLTPTNIVNYGGRAVQLGTTSVHTLNLINTKLWQTGQAAGVEDGQTFTIDDGSKVVTFEFTDNGVAATGNRPVLFSLSQTCEQVADAIVTAVRNANLGLTPSHASNSDGLVHLGGTTQYQVNVGKSKLLLSGQPGVRPAWGIRIPAIAGLPDFTQIKDGQTFALTNGAATPVTFELDNNSQVVAGNRAISFTSTTTAAQLATSIAIAIRNAKLGLTPTSSAEGVVTLGGTAAYRLNMTNTSLVEIGQAGVPAAEPVLFIPGETYTPGVPVREPVFDENDMALAVRDAINAAVAKGRLVDVTATVRTDGAVATTGEVLVEGAKSISGAAAAVRSAISDIAGNALKANRSDGTTRFTIYVDGGLDYGDAPESYGTLQAANGASHKMVPGFFLGNSVDGDFDGQSTIAADGDDNDGIDDEDGIGLPSSLAAGMTADITVTASAPGYLDAWIDFNRDGDWNDAGENVFVRQSVLAGVNPPMTISVPTAASQGTSYARFRFSSTGGLGPIGYASDGEVEDYTVTLIGNTWHNAPLPEDVNGDGKVSPIDVLLVINDLNKNGARSLSGTTRPDGAPYYDVSDDSPEAWISPIDAMIVINYLNAMSQGEGEYAFAAARDSAEGELGTDGGNLFAPTTVVAATSLNSSQWNGTPSLVDHRIAGESATITTDDTDSETPLDEYPVSLSSLWNSDSHNVATLAVEQHHEEIEDVVDLLGENAMSIRELTASESFFAELG